VHEEVTIPELTEVVARVAALLGPREGPVQALDGGITNRNFKVRFGGTDYVVRLPGKDTGLLGIDRKTECAANKQAADLGIAPPVAAFIEDPPCLVTLFIEGRELTAEELREPESIAQVATGLRSFHDSGLTLDTEFDAFKIAEQYAATATSRGGTLPPQLDDARARAGAIQHAIAGHPEHAPVPCHDDLLSANFLHDGERVRIVDWEYAGMGDRYFDLGNFAVNNELGEEDADVLLGEYFGEAPDSRRRATLALFRYMSDLREAMWGVVQTSVSELDFDFEEYAQKHFDRLAAAAADPSFDARLDEARAGST
jgi:thiamine kinase-like enzyme